MRVIALVVLVVVPGLLVVVASGYYLTVDWPALQVSRARFDQAVTRHADTSELLAAHAKEEAHRFNVFAEGVWLLLGGILAGVGIHGLCLLPRERRARKEDGGQGRTRAGAANHREGGGR